MVSDFQYFVVPSDWLRKVRRTFIIVTSIKKTPFMTQGRGIRGATFFPASEKQTLCPLTLEHVVCSAAFADTLKDTFTWLLH